MGPVVNDFPDFPAFPAQGAWAGPGGADHSAAALRSRESLPRIGR